MSSSWQDFVLGRVGCRGTNRAEVELQWTVPDKGLARSDHVVADPGILGVLNQVQDICDLVQMERLVFE